MNLLLDLLDYLSVNDKEIGTKLIPSVNAFISYTNDSIPNMVVLDEYAGIPLGDDSLACFRNVQIKVRGDSYESAWNTVSGIYRLFLKNNFILFKNRWMQIYIKQTPFKLSINSKGWITYCFNIQITTEFKEV